MMAAFVGIGHHDEPLGPPDVQDPPVPFVDRPGHRRFPERRRLLLRLPGESAPTGFSRCPARCTMTRVAVRHVLRAAVGTDLQLEQFLGRMTPAARSKHEKARRASRFGRVITGCSGISAVPRLQAVNRPEPEPEYRRPVSWTSISCPSAPSDTSCIARFPTIPRTEEGEAPTGLASDGLPSHRFREMIAEAERERRHGSAVSRAARLGRTDAREDDALGRREHRRAETAVAPAEAGPCVPPSIRTTSRNAGRGDPAGSAGPRFQETPALAGDRFDRSWSCSAWSCSRFPVRTSWAITSRFGWSATSSPSAEPRAG